MSSATPADAVATAHDTSEHLGYLYDVLKSSKLPVLSTLQNPWLSVIMQMHHGVVVTNKTGRVLWLNSVLEDCLNLPLEKVRNQPLHILQDTELSTWNELIEAQHICVETRTPQSLQQTLKAHDKPRYYFQVHMVPFDLPDPTHANQLHTYVFMVFEDRTDIILNEKMQKDFVANVSHELRTPLSVIKGYSETLLSGALEDAALATEFISIMEQHANRLSDLVEDLLDLSKFETDNFRLELVPVNVIALLERVVRLQQYNVQPKGMHLSLSLPEGFTPQSTLQVQANVSTLEQVFHNLLDNAQKYSPAGSTLSVVVFPPNLEEGSVTFSLSDQGIGIDSKHLPRLFERFYRVDKSRSRHLGGTGLGLAIVKYIVQAHEGDIWVESQLGKGTTFFVKLKLSL